MPTPEIVANLGAEPGQDCPLCPRLAAYRADNRAREPGWFNAPVPSFGPQDARLLVVGMAPGVRGANRTGRPFTGDHAGLLLYATLLDLGFAHGTYDQRPDDGLALIDCRICNAVRCVPPQNLPKPAETATCNRFLLPELTRPSVRAVVALGALAHNAVLRALGLRLATAPFAHGGVWPIGGGRMLRSSYHVSRLNTNTGRLTAAMFAAVIAGARTDLALSADRGTA